MHQGEAEEVISRNSSFANLSGGSYPDSESAFVSHRNLKAEDGL